MLQPTQKKKVSKQPTRLMKARIRLMSRSTTIPTYRIKKVMMTTTQMRKVWKRQTRLQTTRIRSMTRSITSPTMRIKKKVPKTRMRKVRNRPTRLQTTRVRSMIKQVTKLTTRSKMKRIKTMMSRMLWTGISITVARATLMMPTQRELKTQVTFKMPLMKRIQTMIRLPLTKRIQILMMKLTQTAIQKIQMPMKKRTQKAIQTIQMPMKMPMKMREKTAIQIPLYKQEMTMVQPRWAIRTLISKIARKLTQKASATGMALTLERCLSEARHSTMMLARSLLPLLRGMPQSSMQIEAILIAWSI